MLLVVRVSVVWVKTVRLPGFPLSVPPQRQAGWWPGTVWPLTPWSSSAKWMALRVCLTWYDAHFLHPWLFLYLLPSQNRTSVYALVSTIGCEEEVVSSFGFVCTGWACFKEQRIEWNSAASEWEEIFKLFQQGQEQNHHQVDQHPHPGICLHSHITQLDIFFFCTNSF